MKAYTLQHPGKGSAAWTLIDRPEPRPGYGEVVVGVRAVSLNYRDLLIAKNQYLTEVPRDLVPLSDGAGEILEVGEGVNDLKPGDRVVAAFFQTWLSGPLQPHHHQSALGGAIDGMLAEKVLLKASGVLKCPRHLSFEEAATLPCAGLTAWNALMENPAPLKPASTVLTQGTGGVSVFALQFAKAAGLKVISTSSSDSKLERMQSLGADGLINYQKTLDWAKEVLHLTAQEGVDQVIEVGGAGTLPLSLRAVKFAGTISVIGGLSGFGNAIGPGLILGKYLRVQGLMVGSVAMFQAMNRAMETHAIRPVIDQVFTFGTAKDALQKLESGTHFGKIVIRVA